MKKLLVCFMLWAISAATSGAQCTDVFGREVTCPTENDSLVIYNNALKVYEFYEKHPDYVKLVSKKLRTKQDVMDCFYKMQDAVDSFINTWQERERLLKGEDISNVILPRNGKNIPIIDYFSWLDEYRFYQRELENGILNMGAPFPLYDIRIAPLLMNTYENRTGTDENNGDFVNVALYIPVTVKPYSMLTDAEKITRQKILQGIIPTTKPKPVKKETKIVTKPKSKVIDTTLVKGANVDYVPPVIQKDYSKRFTSPPWDAECIYTYDLPVGNGQLWLMGYWVKRKFRKYLPTDEFYEVLPKWLKDFLNDDEKLERYLRQRYGSYYQGILK